MARGTEKTRTLALADNTHGAGADPARLPGAGIHHRLQLKMARLALGIGKITQRAATTLDRPLQYLPNGLVQACNTWVIQVAAARFGMDAGLKQNLAGVNIANPHHQLAGQQGLFDRHLAPCQGSLEHLQIKVRPQRLRSQAIQQFADNGILFTGSIHHGAKAARVLQTQCAVAGLQRKMLVLIQCTPFGRPMFKRQPPGHAQVNHQQAHVQVQQQVFAAPTYRLHPTPRQIFRRTIQGPAQDAAQKHAMNLCTDDTADDAQTGYFHFG